MASQFEPWVQAGDGRHEGDRSEAKKSGTARNLQKPVHECSFCLNWGFPGNWAGFGCVQTKGSIAKEEMMPKSNISWEIPVADVAFHHSVEMVVFVFES